MMTSPVLDVYPDTCQVEEITVAGFPNPASLFQRLVYEVREARMLAQKRVIHYLNVHVANVAFQDRTLKRILQKSDLVYCDGAGIVLGAKLLGRTLPTRLTAADWFIDMLARFAEQNCTVFLLGGAPGVPDAAMKAIEEQVPNHSVLGAHHGFILKDATLEAAVIDQINALNPDILIVGFGTPLQEKWMAQNAHRLNVPVLYAIGAVMDFVSGEVSRCPRWMGDAGFEWLYRLGTEPRRLLGRYVLGNPWFFSRILIQTGLQKLQTLPSRMRWLSPSRV